jgi:hypothetical protein
LTLALFPILAAHIRWGRWSHLSAVEPHTKQKLPAILGIVLDRAILKNGREIPLHFLIQAVAGTRD